MLSSTIPPKETVDDGSIWKTKTISGTKRTFENRKITKSKTTISRVDLTTNTQVVKKRKIQQTLTTEMIDHNS